MKMKLNDVSNKQYVGKQAKMQIFPSKKTSSEKEQIKMS